MACFVLALSRVALVRWLYCELAVCLVFELVRSCTCACLLRLGAQAVSHSLLRVGVAGSLVARVMRSCQRFALAGMGAGVEFAWARRRQLL
eukprot:3680174-Alexandrium_andersonii.AAC.1